MNEFLREFSENYSVALQAYLTSPHEEVLHRAYDLGRWAIVRRLGALDIVWVHQETVSMLLNTGIEGNNVAQISKSSSAFLLESIAAFEMTHRGFLESLIVLTQRAIQLTKVNKKLEKEIQERAEVEKVLRTQEKQLQDAAQQREADAKQFAARVQNVQEEECQRIARELHDDINQRLAALRLQVNLLEDDSAMDTAKEKKRLRSIKHQLDRMIKDVRRMSANLRPVALDLFGLTSALHGLCEEMQKVHRIKIGFAVQDCKDRKFDAQIEIALFRIAQEALNNIIKHSGATKAFVKLSCSENKITMVIQDNGRGFTSENLNSKKSSYNGFGLDNMRKRAELLEGLCRIDSVMNEGTVVVVDLPLKKQ